MNCCSPSSLSAEIGRCFDRTFPSFIGDGEHVHQVVEFAENFSEVRAQFLCKFDGIELCAQLGSRALCNLCLPSPFCIRNRSVIRTLDFGCNEIEEFVLVRMSRLVVSLA